MAAGCNSASPRADFRGMNPCSTCGRELAPQARFCGSCGTPAGGVSPEPQNAPAVASPGAPRSRQTTGFVVAAVVLVATAGVTTFALTRGSDPAPPDAVPPATVPMPVTTAQALVPTETVTSSVVPLPVTEADLRRQVTGDSAVAESIVGRWVPQLSSKSLGLVVGGVTYDYPAIMTDFRRLHDRFPDAIMVNSGDFTNFSRHEFWVTLEPAAFPTAEAANAWCDEQSFAREDCHASRLMHTGGPAGNSKPR